MNGMTDSAQPGTDRPVWWYAQGATPVGPLDVAALRQLFASGTLTPQTLFWRKGQLAWLALDGLPALRELLAPVPVTPPALPPTGAQPPSLPAAPTPPSPPPLPASQMPQQAATQAMPVRTKEDSFNPDLDLPPAGILPRFFARMLDCALALIPVMMVAIGGMVVVGFTFAAAHMSLPRTSVTVALLSGMLALPAVLLMDALVYGLFGNTIGKALLGIRIVDATDERLRFGAYLGRNLHLWFLGFGLGLPVINVLTMLFQAYVASGGNPASYDAGADRKVLVRSTGAGGKMVFTFLFLLVVVVPSAFSFYRGYTRANAERLARSHQVALQMADAPAPSQYLPPPRRSGSSGEEPARLRWVNPVTRVQAYFDSDVQLKSDQRVDGTTYQFNLTSAELGISIMSLTVPAGATLEYVSRKVANTLSKRGLQTDGFGHNVSTDALPGWEVEGTTPDMPGLRLRVQVLQTPSGFWELVTYYPDGTNGPTDNKLLKLRHAILSTIT